MLAADEPIHQERRETGQKAHMLNWNMKMHAHSVKNDLILKCKGYAAMQHSSSIEISFIHILIDGNIEQVA